MFVIVLIVLVILFAFWGAIEDYVNQVKEYHKGTTGRFKNKKVVKAGFSGFFGNLFIGGAVGFIIFLATLLFVFKSEGDPQVTKTEVYKIAPNSTFDQEPRRFTFTSVNEYGKLEPVTSHYDTINFSGPNSDIVVVFSEDQYHRWFAFWPMGTFDRILVH